MRRDLLSDCDRRELVENEQVPLNNWCGQPPRTAAAFPGNACDCGARRGSTSLAGAGLVVLLREAKSVVGRRPQRALLATSARPVQLHAPLSRPDFLWSDRLAPSSLALRLAACARHR